MKILDVNVVIAAHRADHEHAAVARPYVDALWEGREPFAVPSLVGWSFLRIVTNRRIFPAPSSAADALAFLAAVRAQPAHVTVEPGPRHMTILTDLMHGADAIGDRVPDAILAALAVEHAGEVVSFDRDFARFDDVRWTRPV